ncbi:MAG TPA: carboxymuconolactone decarboxylase family protein [Gemmatimonadales bacterium]|nr:carboxymuconolactone decarboxylase family protein [Gemmatimonadales bacterium]
MAAKEERALDARTLALVRVAAGVAASNAEELKHRMIAARGAGVPALWVEELLLQSLLNVGYPRTLAAFGVWREVAGPLADPGEPVAHPEWEVWLKRGTELCAEVYGRTFHKLLLHLKGLHPALEALVLVDAYGKVLGRPGLDAGRREICTLAAIAMQDAPRQLHAHLRGALNLGWAAKDVDTVLALLEPDLGAERALAVWNLWADVRGRSL